MEKCATLLRSVAMRPERAKLLVEETLEVLERTGGRPTDDKVLTRPHLSCIVNTPLLSIEIFSW